MLGLRGGLGGAFCFGGEVGWLVRGRETREVGVDGLGNSVVGRAGISSVLYR